MLPRSIKDLQLGQFYMIFLYGNHRKTVPAQVCKIVGNDMLLIIPKNSNGGIKHWQSCPVQMLPDKIYTLQFDRFLGGFHPSCFVKYIGKGEVGDWSAQICEML